MAFIDYYKIMGISKDTPQKGHQGRLQEKGQTVPPGPASRRP